MTIPAAFCLFALLALSACSGGIDNSRLRADIIEDEPRIFALGVLPLSEGSAYLRLATAQGLVAFDAQGRIVPALAARWIVTDDELSYIFRLNKIRWNDGREVSAEEVAQVLNTRIRDLRNGRFSAEMGLIDRAVPMTGKVVEIRLKAPVPNLLELIAQPEFGLVQRGIGSGPMQARKQGNVVMLRMRELDEKNNPVLADARIALRVSKPSIALARFNAGETDFITGGRFQHLPLLEAAKTKNGTVQFDSVPGLFGLLIVEAGPFLSETSNREAIAMAIDRPKLLSSFDILAWQETLTLVPENMKNRAPVTRALWTQLRGTDAKTKARVSIARWIGSHGPVRPLKIALPRGAGARIFFAQIQSDLAFIGLRAERVTPDQQADIRLVDRVADMSSPAWYLGQLSCIASLVCDPQADALIAAARQSSDPADRMRLLGEAETRLQAKLNFIPIANPLRWSLTRDQLLGFAPNPRGWHSLQYLGRDPT
jgi:ABC-type oligopeptide transport system substrate-binding subunit